MAKESYLNDLTEIRSMMEKSSRFLSLSGWTGILSGLYALIGAYWAYRIIYHSDRVIYPDITSLTISPVVLQLILIAIGVLVLAVGSGLFFSLKKAKKSGEKFWSKSAAMLASSLAVPLVTGGIFIIILYTKGIISLLAPSTLVFYGLALINAKKYTYSDIGYLGYSEIILGLISCFYTGYGLYFWAAGFGVLHIVYGILMYYKYER